MSAPPPPVPIPPVPVKKTSPVVFILVGVGVFFMFIVMLVVAGGMYFAYKAKQFVENPALGAAKILAAMDPNSEVLSTDEGRGTMMVRDKKTGKVTTLNLKDAMKGKMVIKEDGQDAVTLSAQSDGKTGSIEMKTDQGTMTLGGSAAKLPDWMPSYPGSSPQGVMSAQSADGGLNSYGFKTSDGPEKVVSFYEDGLKAAGLKVTSNITTKGADNEAQGAMLIMEGGKRNATIIIAKDPTETTVSVSYTTKR